MPPHRFQVNLGGVIALLSNHLYTTPAVFVRELLQNAVDAIRARQGRGKKQGGEIHLSLQEGHLIVRDDGVGLTEEEIHRFVATIGESSKRGELAAAEDDFIGQFGIGLLSCFIVSREILLVTRSAAAKDARTLEWRGRDDGTYEVREARQPLEAPGTRVVLEPREDRSEFFEPQRLRALAQRYGGILPVPLFLDGERLNPDPPPWKRKWDDARERREAWLAFGKQTFGVDFLDVLPLKSKVGQVDGLAFVLPSTANFGARQKNRVYLKNMLLADDAEDLLPPWAFFVRCVVNANDLRPTANREAFHDDAKLGKVRETLGAAVREYLVSLATEHPAALQRLIELHSVAMHALAVDDDEFFRVAADWFPFETTLGVMTLGEFRRLHGPVRYVPSVDEFRQIATVAGAHGIPVLNAGYVHGTDLIEKLPSIFPEVEIERFSADELADAMGELTFDERELAAALIEEAGVTLAALGVEPVVKKFHPADVPALYTVSPTQLFDRDAAIAEEAGDELFGEIVSNLRRAARAEPPRLVLNLDNPVVRRLASVREAARHKTFVELLYVQALLLGQHPLRARELAILNKGLVSLMAADLEALRGELN